MATGIPLLDSIINGVNQAVNTVSTFVNNVGQNLTTQSTQAQTQLGNFLSGVSNGISGVVTGVTGQVMGTPQTYNQSNYNPYQQGFYNTANLPGGVGQPLVQPGQQQSNTYYVTYGTGFNQPTSTNSTVTLNGFDFNTVYSAVNAAFANLPAIVATIQNPLNSPYLSIFNDLMTTFKQYTAQAQSSIQSLVSGIETQLYQSTSNVVKNIGIDVGSFSNLIDATVRQVMNSLGYSYQQQYNDIMDFVKAGNAAQQNSIEKTQEGIQQLIGEFNRLYDINAPLTEAELEARATKAIERSKNLGEQLISDAGEQIGKIIIDAIDYAFKDPKDFFSQFRGRIGEISKVIDNLKAGKYSSSKAFFNDIFGGEIPSDLARGLVIFASVIPSLISAVNLANEPALQAFRQLVQQDSPVNLLSPSDYVTAYFKKAINYDYLVDKLGKAGISEEATVTLLNAAIVDPDLGTMINARRRNMLSDTEWKDYLFDQRFDNRSIEILEQVMHIIPAANDLTRIADKRIWGLNLPEKYGQYAEMPQQYLDYMRMQGYDEQFTKWFWAAHWQLPSPNQIFEMFQRAKIDNEDMQAYLALTDWLPFFRDKLLQISYNPLTRVDIRRMYSLGMFSYDELIRRYQDIGFSPNDARLMADFTVKYEGDNGENEIDKLRTKVSTAVQSLYVRGKLSYNEAVTRLISLGKDRQMAELTLNYLNLEKSIETTPVKLPDYKTKAIDLIKKNYLQGTYPRTEASSSLLSLGLSQQEIEEELKYLDFEKGVITKKNIIDLYETRYLNGVDTLSTFISNLALAGLNNSEIAQEQTEVELKKQSKFKMPSEKQVVAWFNAGIIDETYVYNYLSSLGYPDTIIPLVMMGDFGIGVQ